MSFKFQGVETTLHPDQLPVDDNMIDVRVKDILKEMTRVSNVRRFKAIAVTQKLYIYIYICFFFQKFQVPADNEPASNPSSSSAKNVFKVPAAKTTTKTASKAGSVSSSSSSAPSSSTNIDENNEMKEYKEKEKILQALAECDSQIQKFESCLLNLSNGKVNSPFSSFVIYFLSVFFSYCSSVLG